jgi:hypothetical protein
MTGMMPGGPGMTGVMRNPGMTGSMRMPTPGRAPGGPGMPGGPGGPRARTGAPPLAPGRRPPGHQRRPARRSLPPLPRTKGITFKEFQGLLRQLPQHKPWMIAIGVIAAVVVLGACGFGSFLLVNGDSQPVGEAAPTNTVPHRNIDTRDVDNQPLTAADVFPNPEIPAADPQFPPYKLVGEVQVTTDCSSAGVGQVKNLIAASMCSQMIRASFTASDPTYQVTAGVLNMATADAARTFASGVSALSGDQGNITGYISDSNVDINLGRAAPRVTMEVRGHFLLYTVIVRRDGAAMSPDDANGANVINYDVLKAYLRDTVFEHWSIDKSALTPTIDASGSASATG